MFKGWTDRDVEKNEGALRVLLLTAPPRRIGGRWRIDDLRFRRGVAERSGVALAAARIGTPARHPSVPAGLPGLHAVRRVRAALQRPRAAGRRARVPPHRTGLDDGEREASGRAAPSAHRRGAHVLPPRSQPGNQIRFLEPRYVDRPTTSTGA